LRPLPRYNTLAMVPFQGSIVVDRTHYYMIDVMNCNE